MHSGAYFPALLLINTTTLLLISNFELSLIIIAYINVPSGHNSLLIALALTPFSIGAILLCKIILQGANLAILTLDLEIVDFFYNGSSQSIGITLLCSTSIAIITLLCIVIDHELIAYSQKAH